MIDPTTLVEWQVIDEFCDCVMPWLTHPFLKVLSGWDLRDKCVLEYGAGRSTAWWATNARLVVSVDTNIEWMGSVAREIVDKNLMHKCYLSYKPINEGTSVQQEIDWYVNANTHVEANVFDIVVVDGILRNECLKKGIELLSERGGIIIADNWQQDYVWISEEAEQIMAPYEIHKFIQPDHTNHEGRPWCTAYWEIPPKSSSKT